MKRLFMVIDHKHTAIKDDKGRVLFFSEKTPAKVLRNDANKRNKETGGPLADKRYHVTPGPDHWKCRATR